MLLGVPNFSEGRDSRAIEGIRVALERDAEVLDAHSDPTHNRTVFTIAREQRVSTPLAFGAAAAEAVIDMDAHRGTHPCVGALDVCPVVYLRAADRELARSEALDAAEAIAGELAIPVFLYGELASTEERRERAFFRRGGLPELGRRMRAGELAPDMGPAEPHPTAGATLVTARPPLAAFNVVIDASDLEAGRAIAAELREAGGGPPGVRAIAVELSGGRIQISTNVHDPAAVPLGRVVEEVRRLASNRDTAPVEAELVGLVPDAAMEGYPEDVPIAGFDPDRHVIERRIAGFDR